MDVGKSIKQGLIFSITTLFIISSFIQMTNGYNIRTSNKEIVVEYYNFDSYHISEISNYEQSICKEYSNYDIIESKEIINIEESTQPLNNPMDSPWPMYCHDRRHTGQSPYSTVDTWDEIWRFKQHANDFIRSSSVIGNDGTVYIGGADFYALYPNGTLKWKYDVSGWIHSCSAIDENGTIYIGNIGGGPNFLYAINPNGTLKWKYSTQDIYSSPAIGDDGTIYFGDENKYINALWSNGTVRWRYKTGHVVYSSPAIGSDGTVYCGSHDSYLYALYPNNGTLKWKYKTGNWIRTSPCIADDGTIYVVSLDEYLHSLYHNGTLKWKTNVGAGTSPTIGQEGTIYCGYTKLYAVDPNNGSVKWVFDPGPNRRIRGATPCNSIDGIIYFGTHIGDYGGGEIIAVNPNGSERWRKKIANKYVDSAPAISEDGIIYIGSACEENGYSRGYLHAFGVGELEVDANGPYYGLINEPVQFNGSSKGGYSPHSYHWDFGDSETSDEQNPIHIYINPGNYTVTLTVTDNESNTTDDTTWAWIQASNDPPNKPAIDGETNGKAGTKYEYTFRTNDTEGANIWYYIEWGDSKDTGWLGPYSSGKEITKSHSWSEKDTYIIRCKTKDPYGAESEWGELKIWMSKNNPFNFNFNLLGWFVERFSNIFPILRHL